MLIAQQHANFLELVTAQSRSTDDDIVLQHINSSGVMLSM